MFGVNKKGFVQLLAITAVVVSGMAALAIWLVSIIYLEPTIQLASAVSSPVAIIKHRSGETFSQPRTRLLNTAEERVKAAATSALPANIKEIYIPIGGGQTSEKSWADLSGAEVYIDITKYPPIDKVTFDAALHTTAAGSGASFARLYNVTDKAIVWFSDVSTEAVAPTRVESKPITLAPGKKLYRVQMYALLGYNAILDFGRVKITFK